MNTNQAARQGVEAFRAGKGRAPALNQAFLVAAAATGNLLCLMDAYTNGWTVAMLAQDAPLPTMPSIASLAEIMAGEAA